MAAKTDGVLLVVLTAEPLDLSSRWAGATSPCLHSSRVACAFYHSADERLGAPPFKAAVAGSTFAPLDYAPPDVPSRDACCPAKVGGGAANEWWLKSGGAVPFWCRPRWQAPEAVRSQYRALPALAHASATYRTHFASGELGWLALVEEAAVVRPALLLPKLGRLDPSEPLYLGDFANETAFPQARRWPPYACGGGGAVFSSAALSQLDFAGCAATLHHASRPCYRADWMVGECTRAAGLSPHRGLSCGACALRCSVASELQRAAARVDAGEPTCHVPIFACLG
eukprot:7336257-Prymnesium_polylepis.2